MSGVEPKPDYVQSLTFVICLSRSCEARMAGGNSNPGSWKRYLKRVMRVRNSIRSWGSTSGFACAVRDSSPVRGRIRRGLGPPIPDFVKICVDCLPTRINAVDSSPPVSGKRLLWNSAIDRRFAINVSSSRLRRAYPRGDRMRLKQIALALLLISQSPLKYLYFLLEIALHGCKKPRSDS
jgi:hypothetical protein